MQSTPASSRLLTEGDRYGSLLCSKPRPYPGHLAFLDERDGTLYAGDALGNVGNLTVSGYPPWFFPNVGTWSKATSVASAKNYSRSPSSASHAATVQSILAASPPFAPPSPKPTHSERTYFISLTQDSIGIRPYIQISASL